MVSGVPALAVELFDGRSAQATPARMTLEDGQLVLHRDENGDGALLVSVPTRALRWPEPARAGPRILHLPSGASVQAADGPAWDRWVAAHQLARPGIAARAQQRWSWTIAALAVMACGLGAAYAWGLPWAARAVLPFVPVAVDERIGEVARPQIERLLLMPSTVPAAEQAALAARFAAAVRDAHPDGKAPAYTLLFRGSRIGPNAMALPGGTIIVTDQLAAMAREAGSLQNDMVVGVLAHELGHVRHRHSMQHLVSSAMLGIVTGTVIGDYSGVLAGVPTWLGQARYSRDAEREADEEARRVLRAAGYSPLGMVYFFEHARAYAAKAAGRTAPAGNEDEEDSGLGIALSSHPADRERIEAFRGAR